jgi:hypothetical protein
MIERLRERRGFKERREEDQWREIRMKWRKLQRKR